MDNGKPVIRRLRLTNGLEMEHVFIENEAPTMPGFIAIAQRMKPVASSRIIDMTKYINLNCVEEMIIDNEVLEYFSTNDFTPGAELKVKIKR